MRNKNQVIQCADLKTAISLQEEFTNYVGRDTQLDENTFKLTIFALPLRYKKKSLRESKARARREENTDYEDYNDYESGDE